MSLKKILLTIICLPFWAFADEAPRPYAGGSYSLELGTSTEPYRNQNPVYMANGIYVGDEQDRSEEVKRKQRFLSPAQEAEIAREYNSNPTFSPGNPN